jgi:hypothetical protein
VAQDSVADCHGASARRPFELINPEPSITIPELAFITVH